MKRSWDHRELDEATYFAAASTVVAFVLLGVLVHTIMWRHVGPSGLRSLQPPEVLRQPAVPLAPPAVKKAQSGHVMDA